MDFLRPRTPPSSVLEQRRRRPHRRVAESRGVEDKHEGAKAGRHGEGCKGRDRILDVASFG